MVHYNQSRPRGNLDVLSQHNFPATQLRRALWKSPSLINGLGHETMTLQVSLLSRDFEQLAFLASSS